MKAKPKTRTKRLPPTLLGVTPFKTRSHGPGVTVHYQENSLVITETKMTQRKEVQSISLNLTNEEVYLDPELRLAVEIVAGVGPAITVLTNYVVSKIEKAKRL